MHIQIKFLTLFVLAFCYTDMICGTEQYNLEKTFNSCQIDQVISTEEGVFLLVDNLWIGAEGVLTMPGSFLLLKDGRWLSIAEVVNCDSYKTWKCRICGYINPQGVTRCLNEKNHPK